MTESAFDEYKPEFHGTEASYILPSEYVVNVIFMTKLICLAARRNNNALKNNMRLGKSSCMAIFYTLQ
jgi:hypothetical protein